MGRIPGIRQVSQALFWRAAEVEARDGAMDVRLQVYPDGEWAIRCGSSDYDQDHRGYWGASSVERNASMADCKNIARDLIEQVKEQKASSI